MHANLMEIAMGGKSVLDAILNRHSVRVYNSKKLNKDLIKTLLSYAVRAPTAMHQEPCAFVVIQNKSLLEDISTLAKPLFEKSLHPDEKLIKHASPNFNQPDFNIFYGADTLIIIAAKLDKPFAVADCWLAAENLMLAATELDLGSCVIGSALPALNTPNLKFKLSIPVEYTAVAPIVVGFSSDGVLASSRKDPVILSWIESL